MDLKKSRLRKTARFLNRLGVTSLFLGIAAAVIRAWVTYWLGPGHASEKVLVVDPPVSTALVSTEEKASHRTIEDLLHESPVSLAEWQTQIEQYLASYVQSNGLRGETPEQQERRFRPWFGKVVTWEGYFDQYHAVSDPKEGQKAGCTLIMQESYATLGNDSLLAPPFVRCWLPLEQQSQLANLKRGQWIVVKGRLSNPMLAGSLLCTDLTECELIAARDIRSVDVAVGPTETIVR